LCRPSSGKRLPGGEEGGIKLDAAFLQQLECMVWDDIVAWAPAPEEEVAKARTKLEYQYMNCEVSVVDDVNSIVINNCSNKVKGNGGHGSEG